MPLTHLSARLIVALPKSEMVSNIHWAIIDSITFNCSCLASAAKVIVVSLPMTLKQTWCDHLGITGLTLAGIMEDSACTSGRLISFNQARGPEDSRRYPLLIFESLTAVLFNAPCTITYAPLSEVASIRFSVSLQGKPLTSESFLTTSSA